MSEFTPPAPQIWPPRRRSRKTQFRTQRHARLLLMCRGKMLQRNDVTRAFCGYTTKDGRSIDAQTTMGRAGDSRHPVFVQRIQPGCGCRAVAGGDRERQGADGSRRLRQLPYCRSRKTVCRGKADRHACIGRSPVFGSIAANMALRRFATPFFHDTSANGERVSEHEIAFCVRAYLPCEICAAVPSQTGLDWFRRRT